MSVYFAWVYALNGRAPDLLLQRKGYCIFKQRKPQGLPRCRGRSTGKTVTPPRPIEGGIGMLQGAGYAGTRATEGISNPAAAARDRPGGRLHGQKV